MHNRRFIVALIPMFVAMAAGAQLTTVATGLNNPRSVAFGPGDILYVGEAGLGAGNGLGGVGL